MSAITIAGGQAMAMPDTCNVPAPPGPNIPTPFPNMGMPQTGNPVTTKILIVGVPALTQASKMNPSQGDEAGTAGGLVSGSNMGEIKLSMGSAKVTFEGNPAAFIGCTTEHNKSNAVGAFIAPSQTLVNILM